MTAYDVEPRYASIIAGLPGHPVEDVTLSNVRIVYRGGGTAADAEREPPENETAYPEPSMFGTLPAYGLFVRHARGVLLRDVKVEHEREDARPPFALHDAEDVHFDHVEAQRATEAPFCSARDVDRLTVHDSPGLPEIRRTDRDGCAALRSRGSWIPPPRSFASAICRRRLRPRLRTQADGFRNSHASSSRAQQRVRSGGQDARRTQAGRPARHDPAVAGRHGRRRRTKEFRDWPAGASPGEIGKRVAENFVVRAVRTAHAASSSTPRSAPGTAR